MDENTSTQDLMMATFLSKQFNVYVSATIKLVCITYSIIIQCRVAFYRLDIISNFHFLIT